MDINEIKKIIQEENAKVVVANEDGPSLIVMSLDEYRKIKNGKIEEKINQSSVVPRELEKESLKIDDLPF